MWRTGRGRGEEQETEVAVMSRREKMEAGPGWSTGGGEEFRFWTDFTGGARRVLGTIGLRKERGQGQFQGVWPEPLEGLSCH